MKKLNKMLITSLSGLTLTGAMFPLVSCNKQTKLTKEEWNKAFSAIANPRDTSRNFTVEGKVSVLTESLSFNAKSEGAFNDGNFKDPDSENWDNYLSYVHNDIIWKLSFYDEESNETKSLLEPYYESEILDFDMISSFVILGNICLDGYDNAKWADASHCEFDYTILEPEYSSVVFVLSFEFDSNKRVSKIDITAKSVETGEVAASANATFSNYGSTTIAQSSKDKFDFTDREIIAQQSGNNFVCSAKTATTRNRGNAYIFDLPSDKELTDLKFIKVSNGVTFGETNVILNGVELTEDTDYSINTAKDTITLTNSVKKGDKLRLTFVPSGTGSPLQPIVTLTATE